MKYVYTPKVGKIFKSRLTSSIYNSDAKTDYEKRRRNEIQELITEIERRNIENYHL